MISLLISLFGVHVAPGTRVADAVLIFRNAGYLGWAFVAAVLVTVGVFWSYRKTSEQIASTAKYAMAALRTLLLCLLILLLLQPTLRLTVEGTIRRAMLFMLDSSASMKIEDPRTDEPDIKRAALAQGFIDPAKGLDQDLDSVAKSASINPSRNTLIRAVLKNQKLNLLPTLAGEYDLRPYAFGKGLTDLSPAAQGNTDQDPNAWVDRLTSDSPITPIGDSLRELLSRSRGQPLAGIFLATDGQSNSGSAPIAAAELAKAEGVPLYIYGVGLPNPKDIVVSSVFAQEICFLNDEVPVTVRVRGVGLEGQTGHIVLKIGDQTADEKDVTFDGSEQAVAMKLTPKTAGEFDLNASIAPRSDEAVKDNNSASTHIKVIDGKIKVLLVDSSPRWEFKYLQAMLLRDRRVDLKCYLTEADPAVAGYDKSPYLKSFPTTKKDLIDKFDLVILGDIDPKGLTAEQMTDIGDFVSKFGGGMLMVPGKRYGLDGLKNTIIEKMIPVEMKKSGSSFRPSSSDDSPTAAEKPLKLELTPAGSRSTMLRLSDDEQESKSLWSKLPPIFWEQSVSNAKPGAEVLLVDSGGNKSMEDGGKMPILAVQQYGMGQVMYLGTDNTWRWRKNIGDKYYLTFWGQMVQRLSLPHLLGESKRTQLTSDKKTYTTGDRVTIFARLYDQGFSPVVEAGVDGTYTIDGHSTPVQLRALPDEPGMYRGEFIAPGPGMYTFKVDGDDKSKLDLAVTEPRLEMGETAMNEPLLREMANMTGGAFYREDDLYKLPDTVRLKSEVVQSRVEIDLWSSPFVFLLILMVGAAEWILRKWMQLK
jgi:uncharacterized membrane protein